MTQLVFLQVPRAGELSHALITLEGSLPRVAVFVPLEVVLSAEGGITNVALERFHPRVCYFMSF